MDCPVCKEPMIVLELHEIEVDHCIACGGIWLDAGELELLLGNVKKKEDVLTSFTVDRTTKEVSRKCPICLKKMNKILYGADKKIRVDKCGNNDGIWFERGELHGLVAMGSLEKSNEVLVLLKDMFGEK